MIFVHKLTTNTSKLTVYVKTTQETLTPEMAQVLMRRLLGVSDNAIPSAEVIDITPATQHEILVYTQSMTIPVKQNINGKDVVYFVKPSWNTRVSIVSPEDIDGNRTVTFTKIPAEIERLKNTMAIIEFCQYVVNEYSETKSEPKNSRPWTDAFKLPQHFLRVYGMEIEYTSTGLTILQ